MWGRGPGGYSLPLGSRARCSLGPVGWEDGGRRGRLPAALAWADSFLRTECGKEQASARGKGEPHISSHLVISRRRTTAGEGAAWGHVVT